MTEKHAERLARMLEHFEKNKHQDIQRVNQYIQENLANAQEKNLTPFELSLEFSQCDLESVQSWLLAHEKFISKMNQFLMKKSSILERNQIWEWDVLPPPPETWAINEKLFSNEEMVDIVSSAFSEINKEWGKKVIQVYELGLINFQSNTNFSTKGDNPDFLNVHIQSNGDYLSILRLAHELGHMLHCHYIGNKNFHFVFAELISLYCELFVAQKIKEKYPKSEKFINWYSFSTPDLIISPIAFEVERDLFLKNHDSVIELEDIESLEANYIKKWFGINELQKRPTFWQRGFRPGQPTFYNYVNSICYLLSFNLNSSIIQVALQDSCLLNLNQFMAKHLKLDSKAERSWVKLIEPIQKVMVI